MGGFGAALVEKTETRVREQAHREKIEEMLRNGKKAEDIADFCGYPLALVKEVEQSMLTLA